MIRTLLRFSSIFLLLLLIWAPQARAQVTVVFPAISGAPGQTVTVPITFENVPGSGFNSYQFDVVISSGALVFNRAIRAGTLTPSNWLWNDGQNANDRVLAAGASNSQVTQSGVIVYLEFEIVSVEEGVTVELQDFRLKLGVESLAFAPTVPTSGLNASNSPVATDDGYAVNEGATLTVSAANGVLANDSDADGDPITASVGSSPSNGSLTLQADGSFEYVHDGSESATDSFSYTVSDGSTTDVGTVTITVNPVNDPPVFSAVMSDQTIDQGDLLTGDFDATDAEGDPISYSLVSGPNGATVGSTNGNFAFLAVDGSAGQYTVTVSASDGTASTEASFELLVRNVESYDATLSGIHQPTLVASAGSGTVEAEYVVNTQTLIVSGSWSGLSSLIVSAQLMMGNTTVNGTGLLNLTATTTNNGSAGSFNAASNTFDLNTVALPAGVTPASVEAALHAGELFVNIRTVDLLTGELRAQLRATSNGAPSAINVSGPGSVDVSGDPAAEAFGLTWSAGSDPDGHTTKVVLDASSDILFGSFVSVTDVSAMTGSGVSYTVSDAATMFDNLSGAMPGSIPVGGTQTVYFRVRHTDGADVTTGSPIGVVLTRGLVTGTEDSSLPSEFVLRGNYPNPFNPSTTISFDLPETAEVQVDVLDLLGRTMISVPVQSMSAGANQSVSIDAAELTSGIYMYRVMARGVSNTWIKSGTMTLIK